MMLWSLSSRRVLVTAATAVASLAAASGLGVGQEAQAAPALAPRVSAPASKVESARDVVAAGVAARAQGEPVEVESERTAFVRTWVNPDGTLTTRTSAAQSSVKDAKGVWRDVDLTLAEGADGVVAPRRPVVGFKVDAQGVTPSHGDGREVVMGWMGRRSKPVLSGPTATWPDISAGVDYRVTALRSGFESFYLVKDKSAVNPETGLTWSVPLWTRGLTARQTADGGIDFINIKGEVISRLEVPAAWDARVDEHTGDPASRGAVTMSVVQHSQGRATLTLTVDKAWATSPERVFPITVDPTYATLPAIKANLEPFS